MKPLFLLLLVLLTGCAGIAQSAPADDADPGCMPAGWVWSQTMWLPGPRDFFSEPRNADGSACFELGTRDPGVGFYAPELGCQFEQTCSAMFGGPVEVYTSEPRDETEVLRATRIGPCWLFGGGVPE